MKILNILKKNKIIVLVLLIYGILFIVAPEKAMASVSNSTYYLLEMAQVLPIIFLLTVVIEAWIPKELIMNSFGENSGIKGNLLSLALGSISAGPIYAAFPIGKAMLKKGASITNIVIILSSWAVVKVPMLINEVKFLGVNFMVVRWILTVSAIIAMGYLTSIIVKKKDLPESINNTTKSILEINEEYCIGCGLCAKQLPKIYEMEVNKAKVIAIPGGNEFADEITETVEKCPTKAIVFEKNINFEE